MTTQPIYRIDRLCVIDVGGQDADTILHNLTTNEVKSLGVGQGHETFVTEVRGKTLGHVCLYRHDPPFRLIGPAGASEVIASHIDRYTIREDATPTIEDERWVGFVIPPGSQWGQRSGLQDLPESSEPSEPLVCVDWHWDGFSGTAYQTRWLGHGTRLLLVERSNADALAAAIDQAGEKMEGEEAFQSARTRAGFPWYGIDFDAKNLPQEADRDSVAISFTKGCYLGQETVARLDALGQVQKKLVRWKIQDAEPPAGTELKMAEKVVGRLTSVAAEMGGSIALGMARRSHFDAGSTAEGYLPENEQTFTATVL